MVNWVDPVSEFLVKEVGKLTNVKRLVTDMFLLKYPNIENCSHKLLFQSN